LNSNTLAYIAGYFDGEGCIRIVQNKRDNGFGIHVFITNTHKPFLERMKDFFGGTVSVRNKSNENHRSIYQWRISNKKAANNFLKQIEPYLFEKQPQAKLAINFCELPDLYGNGYKKANPGLREIKIDLAKKISELKKIDYGLKIEE